MLKSYRRSAISAILILNHVRYYITSVLRILTQSITLHSTGSTVMIVYTYIISILLFILPILLLYLLLRTIVVYMYFGISLGISNKRKYLMLVYPYTPTLTFGD